jgi:hypothetical protein
MAELDKDKEAGDEPQAKRIKLKVFIMSCISGQH